MKLNAIITCEHAGNRVPPAYDHLFQDADEVLRSHRGWDPGALPMATYLSEKLNVPLFKYENTRLLVEPNRSVTHSALFSEFTVKLAPNEKEELLEHFYFRYRNKVEAWIRELDSVLHISIHTFTPVLGGMTRDVDIGLLFDPARKGESSFCEYCFAAVKERLPSLCIEFNEPYRGVDDGFTTYLRTLFGDDKYLGIEIEINQKYVGTKLWEIISDSLVEALQKYVN